MQRGKVKQRGCDVMIKEGHFYESGKIRLNEEVEKN